MTKKSEKKCEMKGQELLDSIEKEYISTDIPEFSPGDTLEVGLKITEGDVSRIQKFTGTCISRKGAGTGESFTVRRIVQGEGVERIFPLHCPTIDYIKVLRRGKVRRAKLNYLRERQGRSAKVKNRI